MAWFKRKDEKLKEGEKKSMPDGLWEKCSSCSEILYKPELEKTYNVCRHCGHHFRVTPEVYLDLLLDGDSHEELFSNVQSLDPMKFKAKKKYRNQLKDAVSMTGKKEAIQCYSGNINGFEVILGIMNFQFIGGSIGSVVGEKVSRSIKYASEKKCPFILICSSGLNP